MDQIGNHGEAAPSRPFSFSSGQDIIEPFLRNEHQDSMYSDSEYNEEDSHYSADIKQQFGTSDSNSNARRCSGSRHRDPSPMSVCSSVQWAELYRTDGNPFEGTHPIRRRIWTSAEETLNRLGPEPKRFSDATPSEVWSVLEKFSQNKRSNLTSPGYFPHHEDASGRMERVLDESLHSALDEREDHRGNQPVLHTDNADESDANVPSEDEQDPGRFLRFWSADGKTIRKQIDISQILRSPDPQARLLRREKRRIGEFAESSEFAPRTACAHLTTLAPTSNKKGRMDSTDDLAIPPLGSTQAHLDGMAPDNDSTTATEPVSTEQPTSPEIGLLAKNSNTPHRTFAPAPSPLQLPERIGSLESQAKSVGDWDKVFEETGDPKSSEIKYSGFLVKPERVQRTQTAFNEKYDALLKGDFTTTGDGGKLVGTPRPELPSKYLSRPRKPMSLSTTTHNSSDNDLSTNTQEAVQDIVPESRVQPEEVTEAAAAAPFNPHRFPQSGHRRSRAVLSGARGEAVKWSSEASQRALQQRALEQTQESVRRNKGIYPGHRGLPEQDRARIVKLRSERLQREAARGEARERERIVVGRLTASELHEMQERSQGLVHGPDGDLTDAQLEVRQTTDALERSRAAPLQPQPQPLPQPQPPAINVTAATPRQGSISAFDDNLLPPSQQRRTQRQHQHQHPKAFLGERLAPDVRFKLPAADGDMDKLQVRSTEFSSVKAKAIEDARQMQAHVIEECTKAGKDPPPYGLVELIGKGSFGRVYMGKDMKSAAIVAVKIIDIDESDTINPRTADSYSEFLKEVNALKILSENKARNINHVIEALPVNQAMWMITEHCGGGSVATLMKPSAPAGLMEKWIIPILREVAEALKWVHQAGIIHRDIKCANVLITEQGGVQLCDFGVAGIIENKLDKRSTIIGTPHWMAPELFNDTPSYGKEVDIWAFGAMTFEIATGLPPNVANGIPYERLGSHLKKNVPRLEGGDYSNELRNMVAYLLEEDPSARPTIEQVQKHKYIANTSSTYPTTNLRSLVGSFRMWESRGGDRKSLFMQHGAQGPSYASSGQDEWNFSTTEVFDQKVMEEFSAQDVFDAYGPSISFDEATARPNQRQNTKGSRRRPPPEALARMPAPLEKIFDPNTMTNYEDNSRVHYGKGMTSAPSTSDLPLRDDSAQTSIKDTMIDLGGHDTETGISSFSDMDTIKAGRRQDENEDQYNSTLHDFSRPALSDPADINTNRRTQDWKFPSMAPPASADPELSRFPPTSYELPRPAVTPGSGGRPTLVHHPTEPLGAFGGGLLGPTTSAMGRMSMRESLIDLDMSLPDTIPEIRRPSTANSDVSASSEQMTSGNPFELERHASLYQPVAEQGSDPAIYVSEESSVPTRLRSGNPLQDIADMSDFSASDVEGLQANGRARRIPQYDGADDSDYQAMPPPPLPSQTDSQSSGQPYTMAHFPPLPPHPSVAALTGTASNAEMQDELRRALDGLTGQLSAFRDVYSSIESTPRRGSAAPARRENAQG